MNPIQQEIDAEKHFLNSLPVVNGVTGHLDEVTPLEVYDATGMNLAQRLVAVMREAGSIEKLGYNDFNKYAYIKESDISKKMQALFCKYGIFVLANTVAHKATQSVSDKGKVQTFSQVEIEYTFINMDNPNETLTAKAYGEGVDTGDKAGYKASTGAHKYFLIRNFNLGSDEDAEKESPELTRAMPQAQQARPVAPQQKAPVQPQFAPKKSFL